MLHRNNWVRFVISGSRLLGSALHSRAPISDVGRGAATLTACRLELRTGSSTLREPALLQGDYCFDVRWPPRVACHWEPLDRSSGPDVCDGEAS